MNGIIRWVEKFLEEPFMKAEMARAEIIKNSGSGLLEELIDVFSHNFDTFKSWAAK